MVQGLGVSYRIGAAEPPKGEKISSRWALLIGVDDYLWARKLDYSGADMRALSEQLIASGFPKDHVSLLHNKAEQNKDRPLKASIEAYLKLILGLVEADDLVVVGFSRHSLQLNGKSYLCPAEAKLEDPSTLVSLASIYQRLQNCSAALNLFVADACRNDPRPSGERSLTPTEGT
jgi:uncharacterized caspase-like protein